MREEEVRAALLSGKKIKDGDCNEEEYFQYDMKNMVLYLYGRCKESFDFSSIDFPSAEIIEEPYKQEIIIYTNEIYLIEPLTIDGLYDMVNASTSKKYSTGAVKLKVTVEEDG